MPRVILYTLCFSDFYGTQQTILSTARCLDKSRFTPVVAAPYGKEFFEILEKHGIETIALPFSNLFDFKTMMELKKVISREKVSLIHAHLGISTFLSLGAAGLSGDIPVIATRHFITDRYSTISNPVVFNIYRNIYIRMNKALEKIIFVSQAAKESVERREGDLGDKAVVIPNSIDLAEYSDGLLAQNAVDKFKNAHGVPDDRFLVVSLSRLSPEKDPQALVDAAGILEKQHPGRFFFLIGGDGPLRERLNIDISKRGLEKTIKFAGYVDEKLSMLKSADAFVLTSPIDSFGLCILEAMAAGLPVVAARGGGPTEIITHGENGLFYEPGKAQELAQKLNQIAGDDKLRNRLSLAGITRAGDFEEHTITSRIQDIYSKILEGRR